MLYELANAFRDAEAYDEALVCLTEAAEVLNSTASEQDKIIVQLNLGTLFFRQQQWLQAEIAFQRAWASPYLHLSGNFHLQALTANYLGNVFLKQARLAEAESLLRQAWRLQLQAKDEVNLANIIGSLAEVLARQEQMDEATSLYEQAIILLSKYPDDVFAQTRLLPLFRDQLQDIQKQPLP